MDAPSTSPKRWWRTSYFWILILMNLGTVLAALADPELIPPKWVSLVAVLSGGFFTIARGLVGMGKAMSGVPLETTRAVAAQTAGDIMQEAIPVVSAQVSQDLLPVTRLEAKETARETVREELQK